jgi:CHAT domain-containing protein
MSSGPAGRRSRIYASLIILFVVCAGIATYVAQGSHRQPGKPDAVAAAALLPYRTVEPRLSGGWVYKPLRRTRSGPRDKSAAASRFRGSAASMVSQGEGAVGHLLLGNAAAAVDGLKAEASQSHNGDASNDLAGALLVRSEEIDDESLVADALAAADDALATDSRSEPALFNRALALGQLGLRFEARMAWDQYLKADHRSPWADEALRHLNALGFENQTDEWNRISEEAARSASVAGEIGLLAKRYPQQARLWAEGKVMNDWGTAILKGDLPTASGQLELARRVGQNLLESSGERLLADAVAVADRAVAHRNAEPLARAYVAYQKGRDEHRDNHPAQAEVTLRQAGAMFEAAGSPMAYVARRYVGSALHAQLKLVEAGAHLDAMAGEHLDQRGYRAIDASIGWERGACLMERGAISASVDVFTRSRDAFLKLGNIDLAAVMDAYLASAFDYAGDESSAWKARSRAFRALSRSGNRYRLLVVIESAGAAAIRAGKLGRASALLRISTAEAERQKSAIVAAEAFTFLAGVDAEKGDAHAAALDAGSARRWVAHLKDASVRARAEATLAFVDGLTLRKQDPIGAEKRFTDALRFFEHADRRVEVPRIYLERGSMKARMGDVSGARQDLESGIETVEFERRQVRDLGQRATLIAAFDALFEKAFDLAIKAGDSEGAFALTERHRARALTEMFDLGADPSTTEVKPLSLSAIREMLARDAAILEYCVLPDRLVAFVVRRQSFSSVTTSVSRDHIQRVLKVLRQATDSGTGDVVVAASVADGLLLQPIRYALGGVTHVAVVPDRYVSAAPFAALYDKVTGRFLIENVAITTAPSATLALDASKRAVTPGRQSSILAVAGDGFDAQRYPNAAPLAEAMGESKAVASLYATGRVLAGDAATPAAVIGAIQNYEVVHFAAHGIATLPVADSALLLAPSISDSGALCVRDIASLKLRKARLVVLAACASAMPGTRNDGAENLSLAFLAAGAPTIVANLSDVDDRASAPLMEALHRRIAKGDDPSEAVRDLTVNILRDFGHQVRLPFQWSNIVIVGGSGELVRDHERRAP